MNLRGEGVCAVVVTYNRKELLRKCLDSLLRQTHALDCILVVDNASTDGTREFVDAGYPSLQRLNLKVNSGGAGGFKAGMQWAYCRGYQWIWVMDDDIEATPECLETMLQWQHVGDVIQVRKQLPWGPLVWEAIWDVSSASAITYRKDVAFANGKKWTAVQYCNFEGALIRRLVIERAGLPDERYFIAGDDTAYGFVASLYTSVIYVDYVGILKKALTAGVARGRMSYYLTIRNRFITYEHLVKNGVPLSRRMFLFRTFLYGFANLAEAARAGGNRMQNLRAVIDGLRDGLHGRFGPPPWLAQ
jgi:rhamnopyranosyl-N-acetylglucosaminyl-diphospho-decaprenol beta-1,3/1,4-galactofuranosyltransferase